MLQGRYREPHAGPDAAILPNMRRRGETIGDGKARRALPRAPGRAGYAQLVGQAKARPATEVER